MAAIQGWCLRPRFVFRKHWHMSERAVIHPLIFTTLKPTYQYRLFSKLDYRLGLTALGRGFSALLKELLCTRGPYEASSSARSKNFFSNGEVFDLLYPITRSMVGTSPCKGRATTEGSSEF